ERVDGGRVGVDEIDAGAILRSDLPRDLEGGPRNRRVEAQHTAIVGQRHAYALVGSENRRRNYLRTARRQIEQRGGIAVDEDFELARNLVPRRAARPLLIERAVPRRL